MINQPAVQSRPFFYGIFAVVARLALMLVLSFLGAVVSLLIADDPVASGRRTPSVAGLRLQYFWRTKIFWRFGDGA